MDKLIQMYEDKMGINHELEFFYCGKKIEIVSPIYDFFERKNDNFSVFDYFRDDKNPIIIVNDVKKLIGKLIHITYHMLGLKTFFTVGKDEVRAWTFKDGMKAPECAGIIHTDFERGFIKAEVMSYDDLITYGSELKVKEAGKARLEGKEYLMQDGDICYFRFNVTK
jgi:ribosome-binding ATPase YchF (GTP1/OBG family)